jgi:MFS family permease
MQVNWDSPEDPKNPKNWSMKRKWAATFIVSAFTLVSPISSSMIAPALGSIKKDFNITNEVEAFLTLSIFVLAYAIGPLFLGPLLRSTDESWFSRRRICSFWRGILDVGLLSRRGS